MCQVLGMRRRGEATELGAAQVEEVAAPVLGHLHMGAAGRAALGHQMRSRDQATLTCRGEGFPPGGRLGSSPPLPLSRPPLKPPISVATHVFQDISCAPPPPKPGNLPEHLSPTQRASLKSSCARPSWKPPVGSGAAALCPSYSPRRCATTWAEFSGPFPGTSLGSVPQPLLSASPHSPGGGV